MPTTTSQCQCSLDTTAEHVLKQNSQILISVNWCRLLILQSYSENNSIIKMNLVLYNLGTVFRSEKFVADNNKITDAGAWNHHSFFSNHSSQVIHELCSSSWWELATNYLQMLHHSTKYQWGQSIVSLKSYLRMFWLMSGKSLSSTVRKMIQREYNRSWRELSRMLTGFWRNIKSR